jgi:hypothetical protein
MTTSATVTIRWSGSMRICGPGTPTAIEAATRKRAGLGICERRVGSTRLPGQRHGRDDDDHGERDHVVHRVSGVLERSADQTSRHSEDRA